MSTERPFAWGPDMLEIIFQFGLPLALLLIALISGTWLEHRHFRLIEEREAGSQNLPVLSTREVPDDQPVAEARMVSGSVVVSVDYFKRFLAGLRSIFGGEVRAYASLLDRARREAILRMKEEWPEAHLIVNARIETSSISKGEQKSIGGTEVFAYGTAIRFDHPPQ